MNAREARRKVAVDELIDRIALEELESAQGVPELPPVAVVIAAYKEVDNIGRVMETLPDSICGLAAKVIVVIDGEEDGTAEIVRKHGQYAVIAPVNRGQGAALRLGYTVARRYGATYIVTADADGQSDPGDLEVALQPVVDDDADFVNGSRRLGRTESADAVRNSGVLVYSRLISLLTRTRITDPANPIRAMRASITADVTLEEPQYQASEVLISVIASGARCTERAVTMRARAAGASKKGGNLAYGYRYGKVVLRTYLREFRSRRLGLPGPPR